jgi:hypothetical protein
MKNPGDAVERFHAYLRGQAAAAGEGLVATEDDVRLFREVANSDAPLQRDLCRVLDLPAGSTVGKAAHLLLTDHSLFREAPQTQTRPDERPDV